MLPGVLARVKGIGLPLPGEGLGLRLACAASLPLIYAVLIPISTFTEYAKRQSEANGYSIGFSRKEGWLAALGMVEIVLIAVGLVALAIWIFDGPQPCGVEGYDDCPQPDVY